MPAAVFAAATACIIVGARAGGRVGEAVASLVLLNAAFALPVFAMLVTAEVELSAFAAHARRLATHRPPPPRRRPPVLPRDDPHDAEARGCPKPQAPAQGAHAPAQGALRVELRGVELRYSPPPCAPTVPAFSLIIEPAQRVGLLGRSGAGKSTVAKAVVPNPNPNLTLP